MATTATYCYCNGFVKTCKTITMTLAPESTYYFQGDQGDCYVQKKRTKVTMSQVGSITVPLSINFSYTYTYDKLYDVGDEISQVWTDTIVIPAGSTSAYKYIDHYIRSECTTEQQLGDQQPQQV